MTYENPVIFKFQGPQSITGSHTHSFVYALSVAALAELSADTLWPRKSKILIVFTAKFINP
jgi:hypothetical protein